jgi:dihydrodipicolinate synthase/N-acetylneuraminate lyase
MSLKLEGSFVAIVTPFKDNGKEVDYESLGKLVEFQIANGTYQTYLFLAFFTSKIEGEMEN